jgi:hypothetical protein
LSLRSPLLHAKSRRYFFNSSDVRTGLVYGADQTPKSGINHNQGTKQINKANRISSAPFIYFMARKLANTYKYMINNDSFLKKFGQRGSGQIKSVVYPVMSPKCDATRKLTLPSAERASNITMCLT